MGLGDIVLKVQEALLNNQFLEGGFILGAMAVIGRYGVELGKFVWGRVKRYFTYTVTVNENTPMFYAINSIIRERYFKKTRDLEMSQLVNVDDDDDDDTRLRDDSFIVWHKWYQPILVSMSTRELKMTTGSGIPLFKTVKLSSYFSRKPLNSFVDVSVNRWEFISNNKIRSTIAIKGLSEGWWNTMNTITKRPLDSVITPITEEFALDVKRFLNSEDWYVKRGIPYKRGYLLHGEPGNGKTSLCKAIASYNDLDIYYLSLKDVSDKNISTIITGIYAPNGFMLLLEDLDSFLNGRDIIDNPELSFSTILNLLDGTLSKDGMITVFTTNKPDVLDAALVRAGRIDRKYYIDNPKTEDVQKYVEKFFETKVKDINVEDLSMSQVQEYCIENKDDVNAAIAAIEGGKPVLKGVGEFVVR